MELGQKLQAYFDEFSGKIEGSDWDADFEALLGDLRDGLGDIHDTHVGKQVGQEDDRQPVHASDLSYQSIDPAPAGPATLVAESWSDFKQKVEQEATEGERVVIDPAAANEFGALRDGVTETVTVPAHVTADASAVRIVPPQSDVDIFNVDSAGKLLVRGGTASNLGSWDAAFIRVTGEGQNAKNIHDDTQIYAVLAGESMFQKDTEAEREAWGTGIALDTTGNNGNITGVECEAHIAGFTDAIRVSAGADGASYLNGNRFVGDISKAHRFITTETQGAACSANWFDMDFQPTRNPVGATEAFITFGGRNNWFSGQIFDRREVSSHIAHFDGPYNRVDSYGLTDDLDLISGNTDNVIVETRTGESYDAAGLLLARPPTNHGSGAHSESYAADPHDNAAHSTDYSAQGHDHAGGDIRPETVTVLHSGNELQLLFDAANDEYVFQSDQSGSLETIAVLRGDGTFDIAGTVNENQTL